MRILFALIIFAISSQAQAWLHFEPIIGYNRGQQQGSQLQGLGLGVRLGLDYGKMFFVADVGNHTVQQASINSVTYSDMGLSIGGKIKEFRFWYGIISAASFSYSSGGTTISESGNGTKLGIGGAISSDFYLNLETRSYNFTQSTSAGTTTPIAELGTVGFISLSWLL